MNYVVERNDTLEKIAAAHDCTVGELVKLNRMPSRMVFPGQKIVVPLAAADEVFAQEDSRSIQHPMMPTTSSSETTIKPHPRSFSMNETCSDGIRKGPGVSAPLQFVEQHQPPLYKTSSISSDSNGHPKLKQPQKSMEFDLSDAECLQRFLKIKVKQVTESDGTVTGTLLVTPNCLMFDPEISHPLVKENGTDLYGMVANMEDVVSVSVYKHIEDLTGEESKTDGIYDPSHLSQCTSPINKTSKSSPTKKQESSESTEVPTTPKSPAVFGLDLPTTNGLVNSPNNGDLPTTDVAPNSPRSGQLHATPSLSSNASDSQLPSIKEEDKGTPTTPSGGVQQLQVASAKRRTVSDLTPEQKTPIEELIGSDSASAIPNRPDRQRCHSDLEPSTSLGNNSSAPNTPRNSRFHASFSRYSPDVARRSFGRLSRTLSARANSIKGQVQSGAQTVASGTQKVAHEVVTHTKSAADHIQTGIQTSAKMVASVPGSIVNVGTGLLQEGQSSFGDLFLSTEETDVSPKSMKREKSLARLEQLRERTKMARELQATTNPDKMLTQSDSIDEQLVRDANAAANISGNAPIGTPPSPPYYLTVRLDRRRKKHRIQDEDDARELCATLSSDYGSRGVSGFGNTRKREFWFAVPRSRVDAIYHFLLQWSPDKYGQDIKEALAVGQSAENGDSTVGDPTEELRAKRAYENDRGFIVLDRDVEDYLTCKPNGQPFGPSHHINREWEIVTVRELCRRLSLEDSVEPGEMPLPQGSKESQILDEFMINQIVDILPPRAEGYPWVGIYNSEKHGFSLTTMYRKMAEWKDEMSPVLLIIRDTEGHVFGGVASSALLPKECYYGTGDSSLLFRFTGEYPHTRELRSYTWTGENQFFINATREFLSFGAGGGHYGLYLDADLNVGRSQRCATFNNEPLAGGVKEDFQIQFVEAFGFKKQMVSPGVRERDNVYLFYPNLLGYGRIVLGLMSCAFMLHNPWLAAIFYFLSAFLDAFDGHLARTFSQGTRFGAMLDQLTDRLVFMALLMVLGHLYPRGMFFFQLIAIIDIASHWLHMHAGDITGKSTHKSSDNKILHFYYTSRPFLFFMCFGNEAFFGLLYINAFWTERSTVATVFMILALIIFFIMAIVKSIISLVHLVEATQTVVEFDVNERIKND
ncbi:hypothetical protein M3Y95_00282500 [Aphelenchoides besseyi]|nr:hypothetical protein M3Y95_00282500 [Aphelenchoides besseyi]